MIRKTSAIRIAAAWHAGRWSSLFQFSNSGVYRIENHLRYLQEIETALHPEYNLHPGTLKKKANKQLNQLKQFLIKQGELSGIKTVWQVHRTYGYLIPCVDKNTATEIVRQVKRINYPI